MHAGSHSAQRSYFELFLSVNYHRFFECNNNNNNDNNNGNL